MRRTLTLIVILLFSQFSAAQILKVEDLHKKSEVLLKESASVKTEPERTAKLLELKKSLESTLDGYRAKNLEETSEDHEETALFFYTLEPVFKFVEDKKKTSSCAKTETKVRSADAQGRPEGAPLTKNASIALDWLKVFCK